MNNADFVYIVLPVVLLVAIFIFLLMRQIVLWYWRVNEIVETLKKIAQTNEVIAANLGSSVAPVHPPAPPSPAAPRRFPLGGGAHP